MGSAPPETAGTAPGEPAGYTLTLQDSWRLALRRSEVIAVADEEVKKTFGDFLESTGDAIGDVNFVFTDLRQDAPRPVTTAESGGSSVGGTLTSRTRSEGKFVVKQPVFQGLKEFGALAASGALKSRRLYEKKRAEQTLFVDVASSFYDVLRMREDVEIIESIRTLLRERTRELAEREKIGRSRPGEIITTRSRLKRLEADLAASLGDLEAAETVYEFLTGVRPAANVLRDEALPNPVRAGEAPSAAEKRPDVEALRAAAQTAEGKVTVIRSELFPRVDLTANFYEKREGFQESIDWDVLFTVDAPIFKGGTSAGRYKKALSDLRIARLLHERARREAELEIRGAARDWATSVKRTRALASAARDAGENFKIQKDEYARNLVSNLDVLEALEQLREARRESNAARFGMKLNYWRYLAATGRIG